MKIVGEKVLWAALLLVFFVALVLTISWQLLIAPIPLWLVGFLLAGVVLLL